MRGPAIFLHVFLVLLNITLLAVYFDNHREHRLVVSLGEEADTLSVAISAVSQVIAIASHVFNFIASQSYRST